MDRDRLRDRLSVRRSAALIHSLRFRLLLLVAAVLAIALGAVAFLLARVVSVELHRSLAGSAEPPGLDALSAQLTADHLRRGTWDGAHAILETAGRQMR